MEREVHLVAQIGVRIERNGNHLLVPSQQVAEDLQHIAATVKPSVENVVGEQLLQIGSCW